MKRKIIIAGATGYLGQFLVKKFYDANYEVIALARSPKKIEHLKPYISELISVDISDVEALKKALPNADYLVSSVGITRQKDHLTYWDVDYQCNMNLLEAAISRNIKRFMYISALNGEKHTELKIMYAKESFVKALESAQIESYIIRPNGFFSDMSEVFNMAQNGRVYLIGNGKRLLNPIHGSDLASFCVETFDKTHGTYEVGGPRVLTHEEIAQIAFEILGKKEKITHIPVTVSKVVKALLRTFTKQTFYGPLEFFLTMMTIDMVAPTYGTIDIKDFYEELKEVSE